jgi:hypothetical protein
MYYNTFKTKIMKKVLLVLFVHFFLLVPALHAQDFWEQLPFPDIDIGCVSINVQGDIFVGTNDGYSALNGVYRSTDSGQTWEQVLNTGTFQINAIGINSLGNIYVHSNGFDNLWKSTDNGNAWVLLNWSSANGITRFYCQGGDSLLIGCVVGGATLLRTTDGCITFDTLYRETTHVAESISDIAIAPSGDIYFSLMCFFPNQGGVYKSTDQGESWQEVGMLNHQVQAVEINNSGDVFIGVYFDFLEGAGGLYALYHDATGIDTCLYGPEVNGIAINSAGDIYAGIGWPDGVIVSKNNGKTFEFENSGLIVAAMGSLSVDSNNYVYVLYDGATPYLYRSSEPTVTALPFYHHTSGINNMQVYPNPVHDFLNGILSQQSAIRGLQNCKIYSTTGKLILNKLIDVASNFFWLNISGIAPGNYIITIGENADLYSSFFVKQ